MNNKLVTSKELSQKIFELGVRVESEFWWRGVSNNTDEKNWFYSWSLVPSHEPVSELDNNARLKYYPALLTGELGMMFNNIGADMFIKAYGEVFNFKRTQMVGLLGVINLMEKPDMSAKMLIYLIEQGFIKVEDIKL